MISAGPPRLLKDKLTVLLPARTAGSCWPALETASPSPASFRYAPSLAEEIREGSCAPGRKAGMKVLPSRSDVKAESAPARKPAAAMVEIDRVSQIFRTSGRQDHLALSNISLTIEDGAFVSILGPSGCGKSTLLYIVGGFVNPTQGLAKMKGKPIVGPGPEERARQRDVWSAPAGREACGSRSAKPPPDRDGRPQGF